MATAAGRVREGRTRLPGVEDGMGWEFEDLFDISAERSGSLLDGEWNQDGYWRDIPSEIRVGSMGYRKDSCRIRQIR